MNRIQEPFLPLPTTISSSTKTHSNINPFLFTNEQAMKYLDEICKATALKYIKTIEVSTSPSFKDEFASFAVNFNGSISIPVMGHALARCEPVDQKKKHTDALGALLEDDVFLNLAKKAKEKGYFDK